MSDVARRLRSASERVFEAQTVHRFSARQAEERFHEAALQWPDARGRQFSHARLQPQVEAMAVGGDQLVLMQAQMRHALQAAVVAEHAAQSAVIALEVAEQAAQAAGHAARIAAESASHARAQARNAIHLATDVQAGVSALGAPPI